MSKSYEIGYQHPTTKKWAKGSVTLQLKEQFVPQKNSVRIVLSGQYCDVDITNIVQMIFMARRTSSVFQPWRSDGFARLSEKYEKAGDDFTFTVYGAQTSVPKYGAVNSGSFPNGCICFIYDGLDDEGKPINLEKFAVASTGATTIVGIKDGAAFDNDHPMGAVIKRVDVENGLDFMFLNQGINRGESFKANREKPTGIASSNITLTDSSSTTINYVYSGGVVHSYAFTPYVDIYIRSGNFTHLEEEWEPDFVGATQQVNRTLAEIAAVTLTTYGGGADAGGGALAAGDWWVGTVVKDAGERMNVNESTPTVKMITIA